MTSAPSSIAQLNEAIESRNPFNRELAVRKQDVWGEEFPDYPSINSHASGAIFEAIKQVRNGRRKVVGVTLKAEKGLGKTHIISRIRHRLRHEENSLFIFVDEYGNLDNVKLGFLNTLTSSLNQIGRQDVRQWQELAATFANEALKKEYPPSQWVSIFPSALKRYPNIVDLIIRRTLEKYPDADNDPDIMRAVIWTLHSDYVSYATKWLSGKALSQKAADKMELPPEQRNLNPFERTCQLLALISIFYQVVICFDQLDGTEYGTNGFTKAQIVASFEMDLYNSIQRGVILTTIYPETWVHQIRALPYAEAVVDRIGEQTVDLRGLNCNDVVGLVSVWLEDFYAERNLIPIDPVYPFQEKELRKLGEERAPARRVLKWCQERWAVPDVEQSNKKPVSNDPPDILEAISSAFEKVLSALEHDEFIDDKKKVAEALIFGFQRLVDETIDGVTIHSIDTEIAPKSVNSGWIDFRIIGDEDGKETKIGVAVIQDSNGNGVQAGLKRLIDYRRFKLTRGCLVRSKKISPNARKAHEYLRQLLDEKSGEWALLKADEIKPLVAIFDIYNTRKDEFEEEDIFRFIHDRSIISNNSLIKEILSAPSGELPDDAEDEEAKLESSEESDGFVSLGLSEDIHDNLIDEDLGAGPFHSHKSLNVLDFQAISSL